MLTVSFVWGSRVLGLELQTISFTNKAQKVCVLYHHVLKSTSRKRWGSKFHLKRKKMELKLCTRHEKLVNLECKLVYVLAHSDIMFLPAQCAK